MKVIVMMEVIDVIDVIDVMEFIDVSDFIDKFIKNPHFRRSVVEGLGVRGCL